MRCEDEVGAAVLRPIELLLDLLCCSEFVIDGLPCRALIESVGSRPGTEGCASAQVAVFGLIGTSAAMGGRVPFEREADLIQELVEFRSIRESRSLRVAAADALAEDPVTPSVTVAEQPQPDSASAEVSEQNIVELPVSLDTVLDADARVEQRTTRRGETRYNL